MLCEWLKPDNVNDGSLDKLGPTVMTSMAWTFGLSCEVDSFAPIVFLQKNGIKVLGGAPQNGL